MNAAIAPTLSSAHPVGRLARVCRTRGPRRVATRLRHVEAWVADDMASLELELAALPRGGSIARRGARHQLDLGGKLLRPLCVALAAKLGRGFGDEARQAAIAVELIHNATLAHDDVIDVAERRRGVLAVRAVYGNAASVLAGDWLLIEALKRIQRCSEPGLLVRALDTMGQMIEAEALQLENRERIPGRADYVRVVDGKTAALFRWAMFAGATTGGLAAVERTALERYGTQLGLAFQLVDDLLDITGDAAVTGKAAFTDLREGKITYPLLLALERDASLRREVERFLTRRADTPLPALLGAPLQQRIVATGSVDDCRALAGRCAYAAIACLAPLPHGAGRAALASLARAAADREE